MRHYKEHFLGKTVLCNCDDPRVSDAKRYFSKSGCAAYRIGNNYIDGSPIRQVYLQEAIKWAAYNEQACMGKKEPIADYMALHQHDANATILWGIYQRIINWVRTISQDTTNTRKASTGGILLEIQG